MVMSISPPNPASAPAFTAIDAPADYARPLGHRLQGKFHRFPLVLAGIAILSLLVPLAQADAAVRESAALSDGPQSEGPRGESIMAQAGLQPVAQQRQGRRGGGEFRGNRGGGGGREFRGGGGGREVRGGGGGREFRGGGGGREFRGQNGNSIGTARIENRQQFRQERQGDVRDFRQERRGDRQDFRQERRGDRQDLRQGDVNRPEFRADRRGDRQDFRQDRRDDRRDFRGDRRDDRRDFRQDRRFDNRDFRNDRRGFANRGFDNRSFNGRGFDNRGGGGWNRGWRNDRRYDWNGFRNQNRNFFRPGRYFPPVRGWNYRRLGIGFTLGAPFFANNFWINDPWAYRLPPAYGQFRWVRYYGDVLLVDIYTGQVVDVVNDFFW